MIDYHIHTLFSCDSRLDPEQVCNRAIERGFTEIAFTEHLDLDPQDEGYGHYDYHAISDAIDVLRPSFDGRLRIRKGIEITYQKTREDEIGGFLEGKDYDFVTGSVHLVGDFDISQERGTERFFFHCTREDAIRSYFETTLNLVSCNLFDVLGHFEMLRRYALRYSDDYSYREFSESIDEILKALVETGMVLEVNTSGLRHLPRETYPRPEVIERFVALGGRHLTVGSDAHLAEHIGYEIPALVSTLKSMGIRQLTTFRKRKRGVIHV